MVEETEAVENLDSILEAPGVGVLHVAPGDLGQCMGNPGPVQVRRLIRQVVPKTRAGGKLLGVGGNSPADAAGIAEFIKLEASFVTISAWGLPHLGVEDFRQWAQDALKG
jgi:2-keto-3-deoxy-L-rhamnonate aldolase RhmA